MKYAKYLGGFLLLTLACAQNALADGVIRDGFGARVAGRGGTNIGFADNGAVLYDNPAAMANMATDNLFEASFDLLITDLDYGEPAPISSSSQSPIPVGNVSLIRKCADCDLAYGVGVFAPAGFGARYTLDGPAPFAGPQLYKSFGALGKILPGAAYRVNDRLTIGGTLGVAISHVEMEGPYFLQSPGPLVGTPMLLDLQATGAALTWSVGLQYQLTDWTTVGLTYLSQSQFNLNGNARTTIPGPGVTELDTNFDITWPRSLGVGVKHDLCCCQTVSLDAIWFDWSSAFNQFDMRFSNPTNPVYAGLIGAGLNETLPLNWRDSISIRAGYQKDLGCCRTFRAGYVYHRNPIPAGTLTPYSQTILQHTFSLGYGWRMWNGWETDVAYQYTFGPTQTVGTSSLVGGDFNNSRHNAQAHVLFFSLLNRF